MDIERIDGSGYMDLYAKHLNEEWRGTQERLGNGNFWINQVWRLGPRFAGMVARAVKEDRLTYTEAYSLIGLKDNTFDNLLEKMGIAS